MLIDVKRGVRVSLFSPEYRNVSIGAVGLCSMLAFEAIGVAAGMPAVAAALDGIALYALAFAGTLAASVVAMVWAGRDCDRHGPFRSMAFGLLLFAAGLLIAGLAGSMTTLILGRVIQGLGVGTLGVALYVATARKLPQELHPHLFALFATAWVVPAIVGPAIAGWIVEQWGWRWLFLGVLALLLPTAALILPPIRGESGAAATQPRTGRMLPWALLASIGCLVLSVGGYAKDWMPLTVLASLVAIVFAAKRLLPDGTLRLARGLPTIIALRGLNSAAFFLSEAFVPLWLHEQRGWSITAAGMALTAGAITWSLGSHMQSRITDGDRRQRWLGHGCFLLVAGNLAGIAAVFAVVPDWSMLVGWSMAGLGAGISLPMVSVLMLKLSPREQQGVYSSALQLCAALCTAAALACGGLTFSLLQAHTPTIAFASVFAIATAIAGASWYGSNRVLPD